MNSLCYKFSTQKSNRFSLSTPRLGCGRILWRRRGFVGAEDQFFRDRGVRQIVGDADADRDPELFSSEIGISRLAIARRRLSAIASTSSLGAKPISTANSSPPYRQIVTPG